MDFLTCFYRISDSRLFITFYPYLRFSVNIFPVSFSNFLHISFLLLLLEICESRLLFYIHSFVHCLFYFVQLSLQPFVIFFNTAWIQRFTPWDQWLKVIHHYFSYLCCFSVSYFGFSCRCPNILLFLYFYLFYVIFSPFYSIIFNYIFRFVHLLHLLFIFLLFVPDFWHFIINL